MTHFRLDRRFLLRGGLVALAGVALGGCESLQDIPSMFERRNPPIPGNREDVFPGGVPGIDQGINQPANSSPPPAQAPEAQQAPAEQPTSRRRRSSAAAATATN
ncbi:hypothetical protein E8L99_15070 [Phreatobacter aquaticus]|uniref:Uncharacterized protein n=1 Tax=Phreatobacter aquaticus TaxID=2570229 RepID=A0A4D7QNX2_9HYPH|nr:hypothetical protein [Phreatobacter aquaticus]QCK86984.1 hypothetical protein E8L99_15070 [Phreatobacter aquaticus]